MLSMSVPAPRPATPVRRFLLAVAVLTAILATGGPAVRAGTTSGDITVTFGSSEIWSPPQTAVDQLHTCGQPTVTCVSTVMRSNGASAQAIAFYRLTGWFLTKLDPGNPVQLGTVLNPWRANENLQPALLGGSPAVVLPETEVAGIDTAGWSSDPMFASLKAAYPSIMFWGSGPALEMIGTAPSGGQRFIFDYRMLDGCHACATVALARIAFDFAPDGSYLSTQQLNLMQPTAAAGG